MTWHASNGHWSVYIYIPLTHPSGSRPPKLSRCVTKSQPKTAQQVSWMLGRRLRRVATPKARPCHQTRGTRWTSAKPITTPSNLHSIVRWGVNKTHTRSSKMHAKSVIHHAFVKATKQKYTPHSHDQITKTTQNMYKTLYTNHNTRRAQTRNIDMGISIDPEFHSGRFVISLHRNQQTQRTATRNQVECETALAKERTKQKSNRKNKLATDSPIQTSA